MLFPGPSFPETIIERINENGFMQNHVPYDEKADKTYFSAFEKNLVSRKMLTPRQVSIFSSTRELHAPDFLLTIPINGLGQKMNHRQFWAILCYRLTITLFVEGSFFPSCNSSRMDKWGIKLFIATVRLM